jgi:hypothetical protein
MQSSCVNNEIRSFNRKLMKSVRAHQHASFLEMVSDRKLFSNHGLHLNGLGKEVLSKKMVPLTYAILDQKKDPPVLLCWNSDISYTDTLHQGRIIERRSTRTKKTPSRKSNDIFLVNAGLNVEDNANIKQSRGGGKRKLSQSKPN